MDKQNITTHKGTWSSLSPPNTSPNPPNNKIMLAETAFCHEIFGTLKNKTTELIPHRVIAVITPHRMRRRDRTA